MLSYQFLRILYGGPSQISLFVSHMGARPLRSFSLHTIWGLIRSVSSHTIWGPPDQFLPRVYGGPTQIRIFAYYMRAGPLRSVSSHTIMGAPQISFFGYCMGPPQTCFFAYYMGGGGGGDLQISIFAYYRDPSLRSVSLFIICGPLMSVSPLTAGGGHQISFFAYSMGAYLKLFFSHTIWGPPQISCFA